MLVAELGIAHPHGIFLKVGGIEGDGFGSGGRINLPGTEKSDQLSDAATVQLGLVTQDPAALGGLVQRIETSGHVPEVLAGVVEIDDLNRARKC